MFKAGRKVWANVGGKDMIGFVVSGPSGPEDKYVIQVGSDLHGNMTYREPADRDTSGAGMTFWKV